MSKNKNKKQVKYFTLTQHHFQSGFLAPELTNRYCSTLWYRKTQNVFSLKIQIALCVITAFTGVIFALFGQFSHQKWGCENYARISLKVLFYR
jgi:hypothetical protein